ncbi:hypothetical protein ACA910_009774 [Epithemia clementina (nom. ined.)]
MIHRTKMASDEEEQAPRHDNNNLPSSGIGSDTNMEELEDGDGIEPSNGRRRRNRTISDDQQQGESRYFIPTAEMLPLDQTLGMAESFPPPSLCDLLHRASELDLLFPDEAARGQRPGEIVIEAPPFLMHQEHNPPQRIVFRRAAAPEEQQRPGGGLRHQEQQQPPHGGRVLLQPPHIAHILESALASIRENNNNNADLFVPGAPPPQRRPGQHQQ